MIKKYISVLALIGLLFVISSCGGGSAEAPETSIITIVGSEGVEDGGSTIQWHTVPFTIVVKDATSGIPLGNTKLWISASWAVPDAYGVIQLYDDDDAEDSPMEVTTDSNGVYYLRMDYQSGGGLEYTSTLTVNSGPVTSLHEFAVEAGSDS